MRALWAYLKNLTKSETAESSKRFLSLFAGVLLVSYIVLRFTTPENCELILGELLSFVLVLCGVASWQNVKKSNNEKEQ